MARRDDNLEIENLEDWIKWLDGLDDEHIERFKSRVLRSAGLRGLEYTQDLTPVRSGTLADSYSFGDKNNVFELKAGKTSYVVWGTTVKYARHVEEGFEQQAGRFVPGFWKNGTFHYREDYDTGMVLTGKVIPGAHQMAKGIEYLDDDLSDIVDFEFQRLYAELNN